MASFTDQIMQFRPYVQQLPLEAMAQVGMYKQQKYEEGVQKIQSYIDNIAGMDVVKPLHKQYLQSKLNELGGKLKSVAAGDFSNFQLVNSVGGMANQIVKDKVVQNALSSTKYFRKGLENMEALNKEGKAGPSNDWDFKDKFNKWMNDGDLNTSFSESYQPYTNYKKNSLEIIKALTGDSTIKDDAFTIDPATGKVTLADAITRSKFAGISPEKIQQALLSGLSPSDWKQMEIDGRYTYSNLNNESFANSLKTSYDSNFSRFNSQRQFLENAKSSTQSATEKAKIDEKIVEIDKVLAKITQEYNSVAKTMAEGGVDAAKAKLFTNDFINGFSRAFSYTETSQTYENNPLAAMAMEREKQEKDWKKFMLNYGQEERKMAISAAGVAETKRANDLKEKENAGYGGLPTGLDPNDVPTIFLDKVVANVNATKKQADQSDADFIKSQGKDAAWLNQQRNAWLKSPNGVDPLVSQHFNRTEGMRRNAEVNQNMINLLEKEAEAKFGDIYKNIPKDARSIAYKTSSGERYTYSPKELVDFNTTFERYKTTETTSSYTAPYTKTKTVYNDDLAKKELDPKMYALYEIKKRGVSGNEGGNKTMFNILTDYQLKVNNPYQDVLKKRFDWVGTEVKRRVTGFQAVEYTVPTTSEAQKKSLAGVFTSVANLAESQKGAIANSPNLDVNILRQNASGDNLGATIKVVEGTEFSPAMYEVTSVGKGGTTTFRVTPEQKRAIFGDRFEATPAVQAFRPYQDIMRKYSTENDPYWSTSPVKGPTTIGNSTLGSIDFPNIKSYGVTANIVSPDRGATYSLRYNVIDPSTGKVYEDLAYPRMLSESEVAVVMAGMTDAWIYESINGKVPTKTDLQKVTNASKKPF